MATYVKTAAAAVRPRTLGSIAMSAIGTSASVRVPSRTAHAAGHANWLPVGITSVVTTDDRAAKQGGPPRGGPR
jgi:hypothetical protein